MLPALSVLLHFAYPHCFLLFLLLSKGSNIRPPFTRPKEKRSFQKDDDDASRSIGVAAK